MPQTKNKSLEGIVFKAWPSLDDNKLVFIPTILALLKAKWKVTHCMPYKENCV